MKEVAEIITKHLNSTVEVLAAFVIGVGLIKFPYKYIRQPFVSAEAVNNQPLRIDFGSSLALALELLLGADIPRNCYCTYLGCHGEACFNCRTSDRFKLLSGKRAQELFSLRQISIC